MAIPHRVAVVAGIVLLASGEVRAQDATVTAVDPDEHYRPVLGAPAYSAHSGPRVGVYGLNPKYSIASSGS